MRRTLLLGFGLVLVAACGASESSTNGTPNGGSSSGASSSSSGSTPTPDANGCCPRDATQSGCMNLGGAGPTCAETCDFFCSTNWRVEKDAKGCEVWRYDVRAPAAGENPGCFPLPDAGGASDAGSD